MRVGLYEFTRVYLVLQAFVQGFCGSHYGDLP